LYEINKTTNAIRGPSLVKTMLLAQPAEINTVKFCFSEIRLIVCSSDYDLVL